MIESVRLRSLGVIADATLPIGAGFTAITGETGAGKTMVVTGLGLLLGQRADSAAVRSGAPQASVEGIWNIPAAGAITDRVVEAGGDIELLGDGRAELYLSRILSAEGRSRATVGGRTAPASVLSELADHLVVVHGQSDQLRLRSSAAQRGAVDRFGGDDLRTARTAYHEAFTEHRAVIAERDALVAEQAQRHDEAARLRTDIEEIEQINPRPGEDAALAERAQRLGNVEQLREAALAAHSALSSDDDTPDVEGLVAGARRALERGADNDPALAAFAAQIADLGYRSADLAGQLSAYVADLDDAGPHELAAAEARRAELGTLIRAHGSLDAALELLGSGSARLSELDDDSDRIERLSAHAEALAATVDRLAGDLTKARTTAGAALGALVTEELHSLALPDAVFSVEVAPAEPSASGRDDVTLMLAPHRGAEPRPVARSASGGELSRVMLALEVVIAASDPVPTFVFDEVDAGIGGAAAIEVGRRLARLAETSQVIAVTHLAQVAAFATNHLTVIKSHDGSVTASNVQRLDGTAREEEMARLLSGMTESGAARDHARELLSLATATN